MAPILQKLTLPKLNAIGFFFKKGKIIKEYLSDPENHWFILEEQIPDQPTSKLTTLTEADAESAISARENVTKIDKNPFCVNLHYENLALGDNNTLTLNIKIRVRVSNPIRFYRRYLAQFNNESILESENLYKLWEAPFKNVLQVEAHKFNLENWKVGLTETTIKDAIEQFYFAPMAFNYVDGTNLEFVESVEGFSPSEEKRLEDEKKALEEQQKALEEQKEAIKRQQEAEIEKEKLELAHAHNQEKLKAEREILVEKNRSKELEIEAKETDIKAKETDIKAKETAIKAKETDIKAKEADLKAKETDIKAKETDIKAKETDIKAKETDIKAKETDIKAKETDLKAKEADIKAKEAELKAKELEIEQKKAEIKAKEAEINVIREKRLAQEEEDQRRKEQEEREARQKREQREHEQRIALIQSNKWPSLSVKEKAIAVDFSILMKNQAEVCKVELKNTAISASSLFYQGVLGEWNSLRKGDSLEFSLTSSKSGFLTILNLGTSGKMTILLPNSLTGSDTSFAKVEQGVNYKFPQSFMPDIDADSFEENSSSGLEGIYVLVTEKPLLNIDKTDDLTELSILPYKQVLGWINQLKDLDSQSWGTGFLEFEVVK